VRRISGAVLAYVAIALAELAAVLIVSGGGVSIAGAVLAACLFYLLFIGSRAAWLILLVLNTLGLALIIINLVLAVASADHVLWSHVLLLGLTAVAMEVTLLSPGMFRHIASRGLRLAPAQKTATVQGARAVRAARSSRAAHPGVASSSRPASSSRTREPPPR
jgi:hypothetical protein